MNHTYRLLWSHARNAWVVVGETARSQSKNTTRALLVAGALIPSLLSVTVYAGPSGGEVTAGSGSVSQSGAITTINQASDKLSINWQSFDVAAQESVNFVQPSASAVAVNRILSNHGSQIMGNINANGQVYLINPNGILFGQNAQVNVGALVASTLDIADADIGKKQQVFSGSGTGNILNQGLINAVEGGFVALIGNEVSNQGAIKTPLGTTAMAAGNKVSITFANNSLVKLEIDESLIDSQADNGGLIQAQGGQVLMSAGAKDTLLASVVNNSGVIEATTFQYKDGQIVLMAGLKAGETIVSGTLDASASGVEEDGGFIETSAAKVRVSEGANITAKSSNGQSGTWLIDPVDFTVAASGGDMTGAALTASLANQNVIIQSTSGSTGTSGDLNVKDTVSWSANKLTLNAQNDIKVTADMTVTGGGSLALEYGQDAVTANNTSSYSVTGASIKLPASTSNFTTKQGSDGAVKVYTVITSLGAENSSSATDLQGMQAGLTTNYALGADIDATATSGWTNKFTPVGNTTTNFSGNFGGLGNSISNLSGTTPNGRGGMFGAVSNAIIQDLTLENITINQLAYDDISGILAGQANDVQLSNILVTGNSSLTGTASSKTGGLVGYLIGSQLKNSSSNAKIVNSRYFVGGLVGRADSSTISNSSASGDIRGYDQVGGLVGILALNSTITSSFATGDVVGGVDLGGLVGLANGGIIDNVYATGAVRGSIEIGGLVGDNRKTVTNGYATGNITASNTNNVGGLIGTNAGTVNNSYWNTQTSGMATSAGGTGLTSAQMYDANNFTSWDFAGSWNTPIANHFLPTLQSHHEFLNSTGAYTVAKTGGDITGLALSNKLASKNVVLVTDQASQSISDININDSLNWGSKKLTLISRGNTNITADMLATGSASLALEYGQGSVAANNTNSYAVSGGSITLPASTSNFTTKQGSDGVVETYTVITSLGDENSTSATDLQGMQGGLTTNYALGADIDAEATSGWANKFTPVGDPTTNFTGNFDGLGNTILNLSGTTDNDRGGMFGVVSNARIQDLTLENITINRLADKYTGTLAGQADYMKISNLVVTGDSSLTGSSSSKTGGLIGDLLYSTVIDSSSNASILQGRYGVGGLIGHSQYSVISHSNASGQIAGIDQLGGLIGAVARSTDITNSFATGDVTGSNDVGGLVGLGRNGFIHESYATGNVSINGRHVGGLVGTYSGALLNTYATGNVHGGNTVGGLAGAATGGVSSSYSTGKVTANTTTSIGGLIGRQEGIVSNSYWNTQTSGMATSAGGTGLTSAQMYDANNFTSWDFSNKWNAPIANQFLPTLQAHHEFLNTSGAYTVAKTGGDITGLALSNKLASKNVVVLTDQGSQSVSDITISDSLSWGSKKLTLISQGNTNITADMLATGSASLALEYGQGSVAANNTNSYSVTGASITLPASTSNFTTKQGSDGVVETYTVITSLGDENSTSATDLQGMQGGLTTNYALGADIDAAATAGWTNNFVPIGSDSSPFTGRVDGLGNTIANIAISSTDKGGMFSNTVNSSMQDLNLDSAVLHLKSNVFNGLLSGVARNSRFSNISIYGQSSIVGSASITGGLLGIVSDSKINNSSSNATIANGLYAVGGLIGHLTNSSISNSSATGNVSSNKDQVGGLVGTLVSGGNSITSSFSTGNVVGGGWDVGGLVGLVQGGIIDEVYATGNVTASGRNVGGLVGSSEAVISNSYATGSVHGGFQIGGLVGDNWGSVIDSYSTGLVTATSSNSVGGLIGIDRKNKVNNSYWNTQTSGMTTSAAGTGLTSAQMHDASNYNGWNVASVWNAAEAGAYPTLQHFVAPKPSITITVNDVSKTYNSSTYGSNYGVSYSGFVGSDNASSLGGALVFSGDSVTATDAGTYTISASGLTSSNYKFTYAPGTLTINPVGLTIAGLNAINRVYDGTTTANLVGTASISALGSDSLALAGSATANFADKNVGAAKAVSVSGYTLSGADKENYSLLQPSGLTADITKANLSISGLSSANKVYDATTIASLAGVASVSAIVGDSVSLAGTASGHFVDKNVGTGKSIVVTGYSLSGVDKDNYNLIQPTGLSGNISKADLAVTGLSIANQVYDASLVANLGGTAAISPLLSDSVILGGTVSATFANKNVGSGKAVSVSGYTITGIDSANYNLIQPQGLSVNITPADLAIFGISATNKTYDAGIVAGLSGTATISALGQDQVTLGGVALGSFSDKNVGSNKSVSIAGLTIAGTDVANYTLVQPVNLTANISKADLVVTGFTAANKVYDAQTSVSLVGSGKVSAFASDSVSLGGTAVGTFADKNVGTTKAISITGNTISGTDASNYNLIQQVGVTAGITKANLNVTGLSVADKVYDSGLVATLSGSAQASALAGDNVAIDGTAIGRYSDKNVGINKAITITGNSLSGTDASNYNLIQQMGLTATISKANLTANGLTALGKTYDAGIVATLTGVASVTPLANDQVSIIGVASGSFADKNAEPTKTVNVAGQTLDGTDAGNYNLVSQTGLTANIAKADLVVTGLQVSDKIYDAGLTASLLGTASINVLGSDQVTLAGSAAGVYADKNVGTAKAISITGNTISGTDASNYNLVQQVGLEGNVTKASLTVTGLTADDKVYDAGRVASLGGTAIVSTMGSDTVTLSGTAMGYYDDKNVGTNKAITVIGHTIAGADASNYTLAQQNGLVANISKASLTIDGLTALSKTYDAGTVASLSGTARINTLVNDQVSLGGVAAAAFADKNVGVAKAVTVSGHSISGADAGNYQLVNPANLTANVAKADLVVTGLQVSDKVYDATTVASLSGSAMVTVLGSDQVDLGGNAIGAFADKNVGVAKSVAVTGNTISGTDADNYNLVQQVGLTSGISKANLNVTGITADDKVYDAGLVASLGGIAVVNAISGDNVILGGTAEGYYSDKNVGDNKSIMILGNTIGGTDASNYTLIQQTGLAANISKADLLVKGLTASNKNYDGNSVASLSGIATISALANDQINLGGVASASFANNQVASGKAVGVTGYTISGMDSVNYNLLQPAGLSAEISAAAFMSSIVTNMVLPGSQSSQSDAGASASGNSNGDSSGDSQSSNQDESDNQIVSVN
ncbi:MAG TPA: hypothetical protein DE179_14155 [Oceanospirillaceae bacterium]|nr:hypothetical protein [Oceanospirillaceae bacterium]